MMAGAKKSTTLIFDLDGTLIDSAPSILACMERVVSDAGYPPVLPLDVSLIGPPLRATLAKITGLADGAELRLLAEQFKLRYDGEGFRTTRSYPDIPDLLNWLLGQGFDLHLATNKRLRPTRAILDLMGWGDVFRTVYTQDGVEAGYPDKRTMLDCQIREQGLDSRMAAYIGDTREDGIAAAANGLHFYAAEWGYGRFDDWPGVPSWSRLAVPSALLQSLTAGSEGR